MGRKNERKYQKNIKVHKHKLKLKQKAKILTKGAQAKDDHTLSTSSTDGKNGGMSGNATTTSDIQQATSTAILQDTTTVELIEGSREELHVVAIRGAFSESECDLMQLAHTFPGAIEVTSKSDKVRIWEVKETRKRWKRVFRKSIAAINRVDSEHWEQIPQARHPFIPEVEYAVYESDANTAPESSDPQTTSQPQKDESSAITMVAMLSSSDSYKGGQHCFEGESARNVSLQRGDAVFYRGEACAHWVAPVMEGRSKILTLKMSRGNKKQKKRPAVANLFEVLST